MFRHNFKKVVSEAKRKGILKEDETIACKSVGDITQELCKECGRNCFK